MESRTGGDKIKIISTANRLERFMESNAKEEPGDPSHRHLDPGRYPQQEQPMRRRRARRLLYTLFSSPSISCDLGPEHFSFLATFFFVVVPRSFLR